MARLPLPAAPCFLLALLASPSLPVLAADPAATRVHGSVVRADGTPVAGALVVARPKELPKPPAAEETGDATVQPTRLPETKTEADGRFSLEVAGTPPVTLRVEAAGFATAIRKNLTGEQPVQVTLDAGLALTGQVFDRRSGRPLAKAEVEAGASDASGFFDPDDATRFRSKTTTDAQGRFRFASLAPDLYTVSASAPGFRTASRDRVGVGLGRPAQDVHLYLKRGVAIPGRVVDREGKPVVKASVSVRPSGGLPGNLVEWTGGGDFSATSDAQGAFEITGVPAAEAYLLEVTHPDYAPVWIDGVRVTDGRRAPPTPITLDRGVVLTGKLLAGNQPFDGRIGVVLNYASADAWAGTERTVRRGGPKLVAREGAFRIERLPAGTATVEIEPNGYAPIRKEQVVVQAEHGGDLGTLTVERGAAITGKVVDEAGEPVAEAQVSTQSLSMTGGFVRRECTTGADGAFALAALPADRTYEVTVSHAEFASASQKELKPDGDPVALTLRAKGSGTVTGRVVTGDPPEPVAGLYVEAIPKGDSSPMGMMTALGMGVEKRAVHAADGRFTLENVVPGKYTFKVTAEGLVPARIEDAELIPGQPLDLGEIRLEPGATVRGVVLDKGSKAPVGGAAILVEEGGGLAGMLRQMDPNQRPAAITGPDGRFTLSGIAPGQLALRVESDRFAPTKTALEIQPGVPPADLTVDLGPGGSIEGFVRDKSGLPLAHYMITATTGFGASLRLITSTDEVGHYRLENVPPGDYMVVSMPTPRGGGGGDDATAQAEMMSKMQMQSVKVEEARPAVLNFPAGGGAAITVKGVVRRGASPVESRVFFFKTDAANAVQDLASTQTGPDGAFEVRLAGSGEYRAAVMPVEARPGDVGTSVKFTVPDGKAVVDQDLVLSEAEVSGQVTDLDSGQPLKGARIVAAQLDAAGEIDERTTSTGSATSDEDGRYAVVGLEPGKWRLAVLHEGHGSETIGPVEVKPDARVEGQNAALRPARPMVFVIRDESGQPLEGAMVLRLDLGTAGAGIGLDLGSDVDGRAAVRYLADGTYDLAVVASGYALRVLPGVPVGEEAPAEIPVTLQRGQPVTVRVLDNTGKGVSGLMVGVRDAAGQDLSSMLILQRIFSQEGYSLGTDAGGTVKLTGLEPGKYELTFKRGTDVVTKQSLKVKAGEPTAVEVKLP